MRKWETSERGAADRGKEEYFKYSPHNLQASRHCQPKTGRYPLYLHLHHPPLIPVPHITVIPLSTVRPLYIVIEAI